MNKAKSTITNLLKHKNLYFLNFFLSLIGHSVVLLLNNAHYGTFFFSEQGEASRLFVIILSALTMCYFLLHTNNILLKCSSSIVIISLSYSLCSYSLIQSKSIQNTVIFVILPILYYSLEQMVQNNYSLLFLVITTLCLIVEPLTTISILICMLFAVVFFIHSDNYHTFTSCIHYIIVCLFAILLSAVISFPQVANYFIQTKNTTYSGFQYTYPISVFLSRFYPGAISSTVFENTHGLNIYFGLFAILCFLSFFLNGKVSAKKKKGAFILIIIYLGIMLLSPMHYLLELCHNSSSTYLYYDFFFVFYFLLLAYEGLTKLSDLSKTGKFISIVSYCIITIIVLIGSSHNIHPMAQSTILAFSVVYILYFCFSNILSQKIKKYFILLILAELIGNSICISFQEYVPQTVQCKDKFFNEESSLISDDLQKDDMEDKYSSFCEEHVDTDLALILAGLEDLANVIFDYQVDPLFCGSYFERYNTIYNDIGLDGELFTKVSDASISFDANDTYTITAEGHNIYYISSNNKSSTDSSTIATYNYTSKSNDFYILFDLYDTPFHFSNENGMGYISLPLSSNYGMNFKVEIYTLNYDAQQQIIDLLNQYTKEQKNNLVPMSVYYAALIATCLGIFILLIFLINKDKEKVNIFLSATKKRLDDFYYSKILSFLSKQKLYILSFGFPMGVLLICAIIFNLQPFGTNSIWDGDGLLSVLPAILDILRNISNGNWYISYNGGYGYTFIPISPIYILTAPIPQTLIPLVYQYIFFIAIAFSSFSMYFYLTHRMTGNTASKNDLKALIPGFIFSVNSYMLFMRGYIGWFLIIPLLPLLILSLESLVYKKKWFPYVILLTYFMYCDIPISFFVCITLILYFLFNVNFNSFSDFIRKGVRFAFFSILSAVNSIATLSGMFFSRQVSGYQSQDEILPTFQIFGSFWEQWKQHMIFSTVDVVTENENSIILYTSVLCILLLFIFLFLKKQSVNKKIKKLVPIVFLYFSFNESIMSYIINGFHYQSNVPNRHVFVLSFFLCILIYDVLCEIEYISSKKIMVCGVISVAFIFLCQFLSNGNSNMAFYTSLFLMIIYILLLLFIRIVDKFRFSISHILVLILSAELFANAVFVFHEINSGSLNSIGDYSAMQEFVNTKLNNSNNIYRTCFPNSQMINSGLIYGTPTTDYFASNMSQSLINYNKLIGGTNGSNYIHSTYGNSNVTNSLFGIKHIAIPNFALVAVQNLEDYDYVGSFNNYYFLENKEVLSPAYYAPNEIVNLKDTIYSPLLINNFVHTYLPNNEDIFSITYLTNTQSDSIDCDLDNFYEYRSLSGEALTSDEALNLLSNLSDSSLENDTFRTFAHITPNKSGTTYIYTNEYIPLGYLEKGTSYDVNLSGTRLVEKNYHMSCTVNDETYQQFMEYMEENQLENLTFDKYSIKGESNYKKDGYTLFCFPYNKSWKAYVDGVETEVISPLNSYMLVKTPSGKHTVELTYDRKTSFYPYALISVLSIASTIICAITSHIIKKKRKAA